MAGKYSEKEKIFFVEERKNREGKGEKYLEKEKIFLVEERKNREGNGGKYLEKIKDIEMSRFQSRSRSRDFCQFLDSFTVGFGEFGLGKNIDFDFGKFGVGKKVSVSKKLVSEKSIGFGFGKFDLGKIVSVLVSENMVSEKKSLYQLRSKFWYRHSVL